jgi:hypothetical protein
MQNMNPMTEVLNIMRTLWHRGNDTYEIAYFLRMPEATVYNYMIEAGILKGQKSDQTIVAFTAKRKQIVPNIEGENLQE